MSQYSRRNFLEKSGIALAAAISANFSLSCSENIKDSPERKVASGSKWEGFKYAMCNESMQGLNWAEQCRIISNAGYSGVEIATFTLVSDSVKEITASKRKEIVDVMAGTGLKCAGLHWLLAPPPKGLHFTSPDASVRSKTIDYLHELIDFCGDLGGSVMIFGSPKQRNAAGISIDEAKRYFSEGLAKVAEHAKGRQVQILIEPLDKSQTNVVNTMAEAVEMVRQINHPAVQTMFDFHNTPDEVEPFDVLIRRYFSHIRHIHVQEMDGRHLGTGTAVKDYVKAFQTLKDLKYNGWVSLEVFDFSPGGVKIAQESMKILKQIEAKLV